MKKKCILLDGPLEGLTVKFNPVSRRVDFPTPEPYGYPYIAFHNYLQITSGPELAFFRYTGESRDNLERIT